jgi:protein transport protein SEC31
VFGALGDAEPVDDTANVISLKQPPKWLRRPVSATFGFGGLLATTSNLPGASGKHQSGVVHLRSVVSEQGIIDRATALDDTKGEKEKLEEFCNTKSGDSDAAWKTLQTLFKADSRDELIQLLGFSKEDVVKQVEEAVKRFGAGSGQGSATSVTDSKVAEDEADKVDGDEVNTPTSKPIELTSENGAESEATKQTEGTATPETSLFDDDSDAPGTPTTSGADFFSSMAAGGLRNAHLDSVIPHKNETASTVAATAGSRASSVRSEVINKENIFHIYPSDEGDVDRLITQALVLGDFSSAVDLCLASERYADALLLAVRGGPELLQSTQKAYFAKRTTTTPFLRVFQSIVTEDLTDIVQNADLGEWKVIFVVLCTYAKSTEFNSLADQLGQRLQFKWRTLSGSDSPEAKAAARAARNDATLCYLASRRLEKVVSIWSEEMREEEASKEQQTRYTAHAQALQSFIEKVAVFTAATGYVDEDLMSPTESTEAADQGARTYKLASLYDRFYEYADLLATQGLVDMAAKYVQMTPSDYRGTGSAGSELDKARDRLFRAAGISGSTQQVSKGISSSQGKAPAASQTAYSGNGGYAPAPSGPSAYVAPPTAYTPPQPVPTSYYGNDNQSQPSTTYQPPQQPQPNAYNPPQQQTNSGPYNPPSQNQYGYTSSDPYAPTQNTQQYGQTSQYGSNNGYGPSDPQAQGYGAPQSYGGPPQPGPPPGPPPRAGGVNTSSASATPPPVPAAQRRDMPGWNDAPSFAPPKRPQSAARDMSKPAPIMSPFPMSTNPMDQVQGGFAPPSNQLGQTPPPSRAGQPGMLPPPPKGGPRPPSAQAVARAAIPSQPPQNPAPPRQQSAMGQPPPQQRGGPPPGPPGQGQGQGQMRGGPPPPGAIGGPPPQRVLSPLNPGAQARGPPPQGQGQRIGGPPPQRVLSPPQAPPQGARVGGPPPPGRAGPPPTTQAAPAPAQPAVPAKATYRMSMRFMYDTADIV